MFTLDAALQACEGRKEFALVRHDGLLTINYLVQLPDSFEGIRANFRGVTFCEKTGELLSLPFHKFFNVNQTEATQWARIRHLEAEIYEKVDGSLVHFLKHRGELRASTRMRTDTPQAQAALRLAMAQPAVYRRILEAIDAGYTPLFEYVAPDNQVVVWYEQPRLIYLHSRHRATGRYCFDGGYPDEVRRVRLPFAALPERLANEKNFEGYVCQLSGGLWVKAKCPWYLERHRAYDALMKPAYKLYELVFQGVMDDLIAVAADQYQPALRQIYQEAQTEYLAERARLEMLCERLRRETAGDATDPREIRKRFALYVRQHHAADMSSLMSLYGGRDPASTIQEHLLERYRVKYPRKLFAHLEGE